MSKLANLKKKAADLEHKRLFDRALAVYEEVLQEQEGAEEADIGLFNRVGDLNLRQGNVEAALKRYEQAVDLYVERGFHNNAVALCNKILRQDPSRAEIHFRLGQISCEKGFRSEARRHFQEYTAQLGRGGLLERALTTLRNFADQNEQLDDVRQILADILRAHDRVGEAVVQLDRLHEHYESHQRHGDAQAVLDQILQLDPAFEVSHPVVSDADRDDSAIAAAGADVPWAQRSYAAPELVLFDPSGLSSTSRATPSGVTPAGVTPAAAVTQRVQEDDIVLVDLDPVASEVGEGAMPVGLTHGSDFELAGSQAVDEGGSESSPLDFEPTSLEFVAPPVEALPGLDGDAGVTVSEIDDSVIPIEVAASWESEASGWEIPAEADEDRQLGSLELTLPGEDNELVFISDVDPDVTDDLPEEPFTIFGLSASDAAQATDEATAPPGGWELTPEDDSAAEGPTAQRTEPSANVEPFATAEPTGTVDVFDGIYQPDSIDRSAADHQPEAADRSGSLYRDDAGDEPEALYWPAADAPLDALHQPDADDSSELFYQPDGGDWTGSATAADVAEEHPVDAEFHVAAEAERSGEPSSSIETSGVDEVSGLIGIAGGIEPSAVIDFSEAIEPSAAIELPEAIEASPTTQLSDDVGLPAGRMESGLIESDAHAQTATQFHSAASADVEEEAGRPDVVAIADAPRSSTTGWTPAAAVPEPAEDAFVNLGDWLREDDEPRSTRMVVEERAPSGDEQADFAEMLRKFKQGVADNVDEDDHASHYDLGIAFREMGLVDEAIAAFQRALRGTAQRVRAFEALGQCFIDKEQYAVATSVLQRSLKEPGADDGRLVGVLYLLGRSAEAQNQGTEALGYYQRVFAVDIEFGDVADRIGAVERVSL